MAAAAWFAPVECPVLLLQGWEEEPGCSYDLASPVTLATFRRTSSDRSAGVVVESEPSLAAPVKA